MTLVKQNVSYYYIVNIDNSGGVFSRLLNWIDDDGTAEFVGKSFSVLSEQQFAALQLEKWTDHRFVKTQRMLENGAISMIQMQAAQQAMRSIGAPPGGNCEHNLLDLIVHHFSNADTLATVMSHLLKTIAPQLSTIDRSLRHNDDDDDNDEQDSSFYANAPKFPVPNTSLSVENVDTTPIFQVASSTVTKTTRPLTDFFAPHPGLREMHDIAKPADFDVLS
jgi:hypothetical protein